MINITMINNNNIKNDLNIIIFIKKNKINVKYSIFYKESVIKTNTIDQYNIVDYNKYISKSDLVIDMNPLNDNYNNLLYCITNNIPLIINKKYVKIKCNTMLFTDIEDIFKIVLKVSKIKYLSEIVKLNNNFRNDLLLEYKVDTVKNINYDIKKIKHNILNIYSFLVNLNSDYRLCDYIECIKTNLNLNYLKKFYLFKKKDYDISYIPNYILNHDKISIIEVNNYKIPTIFEYISEKNINCIINLDIYINNENNYENYMNDLFINPKNIYCLSRIETDKIKYWENPKLKNLYYSLTQDMWIFNGKIDIEGINSNLIFGNIWNDIIFNHYLIEKNYNLINNGKLNPILHLDTYTMKNRNYVDPIRIMNENIDISKESYHFLPDKICIKDCTVDKLINELKIKEDDIYNIKKYIMNKYIKIN